MKKTIAERFAESRSSKKQGSSQLTKIKMSADDSLTCPRCGHYNALLHNPKNQERYAQDLKCRDCGVEFDEGSYVKVLENS